MAPTFISSLFRSVRIILLVAIGFAPLVGCINVDPDKLTVKGFCKTYLKGQNPLPVKVGKITITNSDTEDDVDTTYDFIVDTADLDRYDFQTDGGSINNNFVDGEAGKKKFGGSLDAGDTVCIEVFLKVDLGAVHELE